MDINKFGKLILLLGMFIAAFGAFKYLTNLDEKFDSSKSPRSIFGGRNDLGEALRVQEVNTRHRYEREQATPYIIGGAIVGFIGFALMVSGKRKQQQINESGFRLRHSTSSKEKDIVETSTESLQFCYHCGEELPDKAVACPKCGKTL